MFIVISIGLPVVSLTEANWRLQCSKSERSGRKFQTCYESWTTSTSNVLMKIFEVLICVPFSEVHDKSTTEIKSCKSKVKVRSTYFWFQIQNHGDKRSLLFAAGISGSVLINDDADRLNSYNIWDYADGQDSYRKSMLIDLTQPPDKVSHSISN